MNYFSKLNIYIENIVKYYIIFKKRGGELGVMVFLLPAEFIFKHFGDYKMLEIII